MNSSKKIVALQETRMKTGKSQKTLERELGMAAGTYQGYEYGNGLKTIRAAIRIARALNSTVEELWGAPNESIPQPAENSS